MSVAPPRSRALPALVVAALVFSSPVSLRAAPGGPVAFAAPAGDRPAGTFGAARILPSGRLSRPLGAVVPTGAGSAGLALTPDGRYAIVAAAAESDPSLVVIDLADFRVVSRTAPGWTFSGGVVAAADPLEPTRTLVFASLGARDAVAVFDLAPLGTLVPDARPTIPVPSPAPRGRATDGRAGPGALRLSPDGERVAVASALAGTVATIDVRSRRLARTPLSVGYDPVDALYANGELAAVSPGLLPYARLAVPVAVPAFSAPPADPDAAVLTVAGAGGTPPATSISVDPPVLGARAAGGADPNALAATPDGAYAFIAMGNLDRVAVAALRGPSPRLVGGTDLRLYPHGPYGTHPDALAVSPNGKRLYVALAGIDAVAVLDASDPVRPRRLGLIPVGVRPSALAVSRDGRDLYVANAGEGRMPGSLERIGLSRVRIRPATLTALRDLRTARPPRTDSVVPQLGGHPSRTIRHVVLVETDPASYDAIFGDLRDGAGRAHGPGDPRAALLAAVSPNLRALARGFALAGNFYGAPSRTLGFGLLSAGENTARAQRVERTRRARGAAGGYGADPDDAGRAGTIFTSLAARGRSFRDYGAGLRLAGDDGGTGDPKDDDPASFGPGDALSPTRGLGVRYALAVPASLALTGRVDLAYPASGAQISARRRAREFLRDAGPSLAANDLPAYLWISLSGSPDRSNDPARIAAAADEDAAVGAIVAALSHAPSWSSTAIVVTPTAAGAEPDHVDPTRTYAIVVSPWARRGFVSMRHLSSASVLKTEEALLGLPPISLGDDLASDLADAFATRPTAGGFTALPGSVPSRTP